ncbi:MAG: hypothetical protein JWM21_2218 [Acidobacteria bacterium]|nr:hypothetical protein [Acidobacteriota bacterium]
MQIKRRNTLGLLFSLTLIVGAAASFTVPRSHAVEAAQDNSIQSRATKTRAPLTESQAREVTSTNRRTACKRGCDDRYSSCLAGKKAKGWSDDRAEKTCGLAARSCKAGCDRR